MAETFRHRLRVRFNECDPQGVVFCANYPMYLDIDAGEPRHVFVGAQSLEKVAIPARLRDGLARFDQTAADEAVAG